MDPAVSDDTSLSGLLDIVWRGKWIIIVITGLFTVATGIAALLMPKKYTAVTMVSPVTNDQRGSGGLGSLASQFGGSLTSLTGISLGANADRYETIGVLQSGVLTERYIREHQLLPVLYADLWDPEKKTWQVDDSDEVPTVWLANQLFRARVIGVTDNAKTGLVTLTVTWTDAESAATWANGVVRLTNDYLRGQAIEKSERHIQYLTEQAAKTDIAQVRTAIYSVMESEIKSIMMAKGTDEYALKVIDPAVAPERKSSPKSLIWVIVGFLGGAFVSIAIVLFRRTWTVDRQLKTH